MHTETTPNPLAMKFILDRPVVQEGDYVFSSSQSVASWPVLDEILSLPGVHSVFLTRDFMTITKTPEIAWSLLESVVLSILQHHQGDFPLDLSSQGSAPESTWDHWTPPSTEVAEICQEIEALLESRIRPAIEADGGAIAFCAFENGVVYVRLQGACVSCPHSQETLKQGIEQTLCYYIPEVQSVHAIS